MIEKLNNNETMVEQARARAELTESELSQISGGIVDDGSGNIGWCGTKPPGWHPPVVHRS
jgi:bacteriocin-like protein